MLKELRPTVPLRPFIAIVDDPLVLGGLGNTAGKFAAPLPPILPPVLCRVGTSLD
ncbi:hypothetical protein FRC17_007488, partial [Serendipita sp. 399]